MSLDEPQSRSVVPWGRLGLELGVVVIGILLALGIDSWWGGVQDRAREAELLAQLRAELDRSEAQLIEEIAETEATTGAASRLVQMSRGELDAPWDSISSWMRRVAIYSDPIPMVATAQSIASSGDLYLLGDDHLRTEIVAHLDKMRQLDVRVLPYERELNELVRAMTELVDPQFWGESVEVGALEGGVEGYVASQAATAPPPDADQLLTGDRFKLIAFEIFWVHEDLRWLQAEMLRSTQGLAASVEAER